MTTTYKTNALFAPITVPSPADVLGGAVRTLRLWQGRISLRRHMLELDDHLLADIGLDRPAAKREAAKPFWRA